MDGLESTNRQAGVNFSNPAAQGENWMDVTVLGAFFGGLLSFVSPCVLPLVPPYLCYVAGITHDELSAAEPSVQRRVVASSFAFVMGFAVVFVSLGAIATSFGQLITESADVLTKIAGVLIILFGLHFLGWLKIPFLYREARINVENRGGLIGAFLLGLAFAFGWTPCVGPILAAILFMAGGEDTVSQGIFLLGAYAMGIGIPFILAASFASRFLAVSSGLRKNMKIVERISGGFLIATGLLFVFGGMDDLGYWILEIFPFLGRIG